jgi:hypothetical protein
MSRNPPSYRESDSASGFDRFRDLAAIVLLLLLNPVLWTFNSSVRYFPPDAFQYIEQAQRFVATLSLHNQGFGHIDSGTILPPLLPILLALCSLFSEDLLACAEYVSSFSILIATVPLYFLIARASSRATAILIVAYLQVHAIYYEIALWPLTEALFVMASSLALLALQSLLGRRHPAVWIALLVGATSVLVFFSRQIGLLFVFFSVLAVLTLPKPITREPWKLRFLRAGAITAGALMLLLPYSLAVYGQTGHHPLKQHFRTGDYLVPATPEDLVALARLEEGSNRGSDYRSLYESRRNKRELNGNATEMLGSLEAGPTVAPGLLERIRQRLAPLGLARRLIANLNHLRSYMGPGLFILFSLAMLMPIIRRVFPGKLASHSDMLWLWNLTYLAGLSCISGRIDRYLIGLLPFAIALLGIEAYGAAISLRVSASTAVRRTGLAIVALSLMIGVALTPAFWNSIQRSPKLDVPGIPMNDMRALIHDREPVFSMTPFEAHLAGGLWRALPNDNLAKLRAYGKHTGVRWLLVTRQSSMVGEAMLYSNARWYLDPQLQSRPDLPVQLRASYDNGMLLLFELGQR